MICADLGFAARDWLGHGLGDDGAVARGHEIIPNPVAGVSADPLERQKVMIVADEVVALASWLLAFLFWLEAGLVGQVCVIMFVRVAGYSFYLPAFQSSTSSVVPEQHMIR